MKRFYGVMEYAATGEGLTIYYYVSHAEDAEAFKEMMIEECQIDPYFHVGIEIFDEVTEDTPPLVVEHFRMLKLGAGEMKFYSHVNYS